MDDKPAIEYHPFGTITLNFDDQPVKLRRCRLGDLEFAKNLLEEKRDERGEERRLAVEEIGTLRQTFTELPEELTDEIRDDLRRRIERMNSLAALLDSERIDIIYGWLGPVAARMGDGPVPVKEDWPLELFDAATPNNIIEHWQTRPLASGRPNPNGTQAVEASSSTLSPPTVSSPPAPQPR